MDSAFILNDCKRLLEELEACGPVPDVLKHLASTLNHLPPRVAPRLHKEYHQCLEKAADVLNNLLSNLDIDDASLLDEILHVMFAYGNFRISQITYHIETHRDDELKFTPIMTKTKWYDLNPLLPPAEKVDWKTILSHTSLRNQLLFQKLHFHAIVSQLDRFNTMISAINKSAKKVAEKLASEEVVNLTAIQFNLLTRFLDGPELSKLLEAIIVKSLDDTPYLANVINQCVINDPTLQELFVTKMIEQIKSNVLKRKRSHDDEGSLLTIEGAFDSIISGLDPIKQMEAMREIRISSKSVKKEYLQKWIAFLDEVCSKKTLTPQSSVMMVQALTVLLYCCSKSYLVIQLSKIVDATSHRKLDKFFKICGPSFLKEFTRNFSHLDESLATFYKSYFARYMRHSTARGYHKDAEKFSQYVDLITESKKYSIQYVFLCELSNLLDSQGGIEIRACNKSTQLYVDYGKNISKELYKFIKNQPLTDLTSLDALVCIIKVAVNQKDQQMLDTYGELMLKLYSSMCSRIEELIDVTKSGHANECEPIDNHLFSLMNIYSVHRNFIEPYLCYELNSRISELLLIGETSKVVISKDEKKSIYENLKSQLEAMEQKDDLVFQTIINNQFPSTARLVIGKELCYEDYLDQIVPISAVLKVLFQTCDSKIYATVVNDLVKQFENCDALDHPRAICLLFILESLILRQKEKDDDKRKIFQAAFPTIGCCLIRIAKSVELGPSVLSFTNPGTHKTSGGLQCCTYSHCIRIYALIFERYPITFTNSLITDAMQICISSNLTRYAKCKSNIFIQLASSISRLLKAVCMGKRDVVEQAIPVFLSVFAMLIRCIIFGSDRKELEDNRPQVNGYVGDVNGTSNGGAKNPTDECKDYESHLENLSHDVGRLANNLCHLETKLVDYAPHLISTYIKDTQRASCSNFVKKHLDEGMFRIFNLVDSYQKDRQEQVIEAGVQRKTTAGRARGSLFEMVHARLDQASREIFKTMHDEYNRFHRYLGKV